MGGGGGAAGLTARTGGAEGEGIPGDRVTEERRGRCSRQQEWTDEVIRALHWQAAP